MLISGNYYHIYNRSNSGALIFYNENHYQYFLNKFREYLSDYLEFLSYCLIPNHFHILIKVKEKTDPVFISQKFSNFFNCYSKTINKDQNRYGSIFQKPFKRKLIENESNLFVLINYIHRNPIHHNLCDNVNDYKWSSYNEIINSNNQFISIKNILNLFVDLNDFKLLVDKSIEDYKNIAID